MQDQTAETLTSPPCKLILAVIIKNAIKIKAPVIPTLRCSPVDERSSDSENRKAYRTNSGSVADHPPLVIAGLDPAIQEIPGSCYVCPGIT